MTIFDDLKTLAKLICPELAARQFYVIDHPDSWPRVDAFAYIILDNFAPLEIFLRDRGEWCGEGPAIVLCQPDAPREVLVSVLCHEVAHFFGAKPPRRTGSVTAEVLAADSERLRVFGADPEPATDARPRWAIGGHDSAWIRCAIHLWWRCCLEGAVSDYRHLYTGHALDLSSPHFYWTALGNEPIAMQRWPFEEILATEEPERFRNLFLSDLAHWIKTHPTIEGKKSA